MSTETRQVIIAWLNAHQGPDSAERATKCAELFADYMTDLNAAKATMDAAHAAFVVSAKAYQDLYGSADAAQARRLVR